MSAVRAIESRDHAGLGLRGGFPDPRAASLLPTSPVLVVDESGAGAFLSRGGAG